MSCSECGEAADTLLAIDGARAEYEARIDELGRELEDALADARYHREEVERLEERVGELERVLEEIVRSARGVL